MADYSDIVDELETVANAFASVDFFLYEKVSEVNGKQKDKAYPMILVKESPNTSRGSVNNLGLPTNKKYTFNIFCYNLYNTDSQKIKTIQEAQAEVDLWLDQYLGKFFERNIDACNGFYVVDQDSVNGFLAKGVHNDKLVAATYTVTVGLQSSCEEGVFNF